MGLTSYFCDPYAVWQKGWVENSNGRLRRQWPRSFDIFSIKGKEFTEMVDNHNATPRKTLAWRSPAEVFNESLFQLKSQEEN